MTDMALKPIYGKNLLLQNQLTNDLEIQYVALDTKVGLIITFG